MTSKKRSSDTIKPSDKALLIYKESLKNNIPNLIKIKPQQIYHISSKIAALFNTTGGFIIIEDENRLDNDETINEVIKRIKAEANKLSTSINIKITKFLYKNNNILLIEVPDIPLSERPVYNITLKYKAYYIYCDNEIKEMDRKQVDALMLLNNKIKIEDTLCQHVKVNLLNEEDINTFLDLLRKKYNQLNKYNDLDIIKLYELRGINTYTLCYIMSFYYFPQIIFPNLLVKIDNKITNEIKYIDGSIPHQYRKTIIELKKQLNYKLLFTKDEKLVNKTKYLFSVIEELVYNALVHRDYGTTRNDPITINIKTSELEIISPGGYFNTNSNLINSNRKAHNNPKIKIIMDLLNQEKTNHGFKYIRTISKLHNIKLPSLKIENGFFIATVYPEASKTIYQEPYTISNMVAFCSTPKSKLEIYHQFFNPNNDDYKYFNKKYLEPLIKMGVLELTIPDKPTSKYQKLVAKEELIRNISTADVIY